MPFHFLPPPPPPHVMHAMMAVGLAASAGALFFARRRVTETVGSFTSRFSGRWPALRRTTPYARSGSANENLAFSEYREATLRKLEDEALEFRRFLEGLRRAADAKDFEAFLIERRAGVAGVLPPPRK